MVIEDTFMRHQIWTEGYWSTSKSVFGIISSFCELRRRRKGEPKHVITPPWTLELKKAWRKTDPQHGGFPTW